MIKELTSDQTMWLLTGEVGQCPEVIELEEMKLTREQVTYFWEGMNRECRCVYCGLVLGECDCDI